MFDFIFIYWGLFNYMLLKNSVQQLKNFPYEVKYQKSIIEWWSHSIIFS